MLILGGFSGHASASIARVISVVVVSRTVLGVRIMISEYGGVFLYSILQGRVVGVSLSRSLRLVCVAYEFVGSSYGGQVVCLLYRAGLNQVGVGGDLRIGRRVKGGLSVSKDLFALCPGMQCYHVLSRVDSLADGLYSLFDGGFAYSYACDVLDRSLS